VIVTAAIASTDSEDLDDKACLRVGEVHRCRDGSRFVVFRDRVSNGGDALSLHSVTSGHDVEEVARNDTRCLTQSTLETRRCCDSEERVQEVVARLVKLLGRDGVLVAELRAPNALDIVIGGACRSATRCEGADETLDLEVHPDRLVVERLHEGVTMRRGGDPPVAFERYECFAHWDAAHAAFLREVLLAYPLSADEVLAEDA
jgi:hypothetical protein